MIILFLICAVALLWFYPKPKPDPYLVKQVKLSRAGATFNKKQHTFVLNGRQISREAVQFGPDEMVESFLLHENQISRSDKEASNGKD